MNYKRKTTQGFSIGSVALDFTGGILSILQMLLNAYNYGDWRLLLDNPTKFGLGIISSTFDVIFFVQHYGLYPGGSGEEDDKNEIDLKSVTKREV
ncbi:hypothetical protein ILUMI_11413 [Ignelater luminosus]|uniref:Cystinosin n=1 Tax=Ignelater luminosus TaxID=2038154 RepID=A0A8K0D0B3_IGNLU|nr:hypothetical protein ILUMI_11413 [Ignelater luminosus]